MAEQIEALILVMERALKLVRSDKQELLSNYLSNPSNDETDKFDFDIEYDNLKDVLRGKITHNLMFISCFASRCRLLLQDLPAL